MIDTPLIILAAIWVSFTGYAIWYVTSAKRNVPITFDDAKTLWKIHKKNAKCAGHKWHPILRKSGKISGFERMRLQIHAETTDNIQQAKK